MKPKPNIYEPVAMLCERLGLEPNMVREIVVTPTTVRAEVFRGNEYGFKHIVQPKPNIYEPVAMLCERLGLEPNMVREIVVTPTTVRAEVFRGNEYGFKHIVHDGGPDEGKVAVDIQEFEVTTVD